MKIRFRVFLLMMTAVFIVGISMSGAAAQDMPGMPGMKMPMPKAKTKAKPKAKTKAFSKRKSKTSSKAKPSSKTTPKAKPAPKQREMNMPGMNMPSPTQTQTPKSTPKQTPMPTDMMNMPMSSPTPVPSSSPMRMEMPSPAPTATPKPMDMPMNMKMPMNMPSPTPTPIVPDEDEANKPPIPPFPAPKRWGKPVNDELPHSFILADLLEFSPKGGDSNFRWDTEGWYGGDFNRLWFKSEGETSTVEKDYAADFQLLYGRFIKTYYDFQIGGRIQTNSFRGSNATRVQGVVGIEGLRPFRYAIEALAFVDPKGNVSGRFTASRDFLMTQRIVLQPRFETELAIQKVERFKTGRGLNNIDVGLRLRYAIRREFAPYIGISYERSFFGTADLVRQDGGSPSRFRFVMGIRLWH